MKLRTHLRTSFFATTLIAALAITHATSASDISALYPGVKIFRHGTHVVAIYGKPMTLGATPLEAVGNWLTEGGDALGVENLDLRLTRKHAIGAGRLTVVSHSQFIDGIPVEGGFTRIVVHNGSPNRVVHVGARLAHPPAGGFRPTAIDGAAALRIVQALPGYAALSDWSSAEMVIIGGAPDSSVTTPVRSWKFRGAAQGPGPSEVCTFFVDAADGQLVHVRDEVYYGGEITGQVSGWATPGTSPDIPGNEPVQVCLEDVLVEVVGGDGDSDYTYAVEDCVPNDLNEPNNPNDPNYGLYENGIDNVSVTASFTGRWVTVVGNLVPEPDPVPWAPAPRVQNFYFNPNPEEFSTARVNCFIHATGAHNFYKARQPVYDGIDAPITCKVNDLDDRIQCNARFEPPSTIMFHRAYLDCVNTAYSSWIAHEYGHFILTRRGLMEQGSFAEGFGDSMAILIYNDHCWGKGLYVAHPNDCERDHRWPKEEYPCEGSAHECATLLGGVWWDIKVGLEDKYNDISEYGEEDCPSAFFPAGHDPDIFTPEKCGLEVTRQLFTNWSRMTGGGLNEQGAHPVTLGEVLSVDYDHDGDPDTPTLHDTQIREAFGLHNIPPVLDPPGLPGSAEHQARKHRYLSIDPTTNFPSETVIKVEIAEMRRCQNAPTRACLGDSDCDDVCDDVAGDPPYHTLKCPPADCSMTDPPSTCIASGPCVDLAPTFNPLLAWIVQEPVQQSDGEWTATLSDTVYSQDWSAQTVLHIGDCPIVPCVTYNVYVCDPVDTSVCSDPLEVPTQRFPELARPVAFPLYGDVCGGTQLPGPTVLPPDGYVSVKDLMCEQLTVINYGSTTLPQMHMTWADLHGGGHCSDTTTELCAIDDECPDGETCLTAGIPPQYILSVADLMAVYVFGLTNNLPWVNTQGGLDPQDCPGGIGRAPLGGPGPQGPSAPMGGGTPGFAVVPDPQFPGPLEAVDVEVYVDPVNGLAAYELGLAVTGGDAGTLDLTAVTVDDQRTDYVFYSLNTSTAGNTHAGQLSNVTRDDSVSVTGQGYLGTFTYVPSVDASGAFTVSVRGGGFTFLLDSDGVEIASDPTASEVIGVGIECVTDEHCDDDNDCTTDTCTDGVCYHANIAQGTPCDDGLFCTATDECDGNGTCVGTGSPCPPRFPKCCEATDQCIPQSAMCPQ